MTVIRGIKAAQRLGFTLDEVAELLPAGCDDLVACSHSPSCPLPISS